VTASAPLSGTDPVVLQVDAKATEYAFSWGLSPNDLHPLGTAPTRFLSSEVTGGFVGTYTGLYAISPRTDAATSARFDWFDYEPRPEGP
jgi:xylan 1,4-beta-xylosidase